MKCEGGGSRWCRAAPLFLHMLIRACINVGACVVVQRIRACVCVTHRSVYMCGNRLSVDASVCEHTFKSAVGGVTGEREVRGRDD